MKIGRNDPCWCGSGAKYKRCHLDRDAVIDGQLRTARRAKHDDYMSFLLNVLAPTLPNFEERVVAPAETIRQGLVEELGTAGLTGREAAEALERTLEALEDEIKTIASRHSRPFWLHMVRRLDPEPIGESSRWTVTLYRRILDLGVIKHGLAEMQEEEFRSVESGGIFGSQRVLRDLEDDDIVDAHRLEFLAFEYNATAAAFRRVGKGATLVPEPDNWFAAPATAEIEELMDLLDRRSERYGDLSSPYGVIADPSPDRLAPDTAMMHLTVPVLNVARVPPDWFKGLSGIEFSRPMSFNFAVLSFQVIRDVLNRFASEITDVAGAEPDVILGTLWALSTKAMLTGRDNPLADAQLVRAGYRPISSSGEKYDEFIDGHSDLFASWWAGVRGETLDQSAALGYLREGLDALTYTEETIGSTSLWDRLPRKAILPAEGEDFFLLDYSAFSAILTGLFREIGLLDGAPANVKAATFEEDVVGRVRDAGMKVWKETSELIAPDGSRREIDLGVVRDDTLFVVECKAFAQNPRVDRGDFAALKGRRETLEKYLGQATTLCEFLENNRRGRNYEVPPEVTRFESILCSPATEFLWELGGEKLWLSAPRRMPRILVPDELVENLTAQDPMDYPSPTDIEPASDPSP